MQHGIVGYTAQETKEGVLLQKSAAGHTESLLTRDFDEAAHFLTRNMGIAIHVCWSLTDFTDALFTLIPQDTKDKLQNETRAFAGDCKIFYIPRLLGLTLTRRLQGNFYERSETNMYMIQHWMPNDTIAPVSASEVARYGEQIVVGLESMGIYTDKLTSPVGVFSNQLTGDYPTVYTFNEDWLEAMNYCQPMMGNEWRSAYKLGFFPETWGYDLISAYPYFIADLPDTDQCTVTYSTDVQSCHWGIVKGQIEVWSDISPIVYTSSDGMINPAGKWEGYFTTEEIRWLKNRQAGDFKLEDGYFFKFHTTNRPYRKVMRQLLETRKSQDEMVSNLSKRMAQGISGKLDQTDKDGGLGEFYNPVLAAITRSRCRLAVADFILDHIKPEHLITVQVDGCLSDSPVSFQEDQKPGSWRLDSNTPALILGKGEIWRPGKRPLGISYDEILSLVKSKPHASFYELSNGRYIDLLLKDLDIDRHYTRPIKRGQDLFNQTIDSRPINIGLG